MPRKYNDRIGDICEIQTNYDPTPKGVYHKLPAELSDGQLVRLLEWKVMEDRHTAVWSVQPLDRNEAEAGSVIAGVWERHFRLIKPNTDSTESKTATIIRPSTIEPLTQKVYEPARTIPPFPGAEEYLQRIPELIDLPERNHEDAVKNLLVSLGHDPNRIRFQSGHMDLQVQDHTGKSVIVVEVKRSIASEPQRNSAIRQGFDYANRAGARFVVISDADRFEVYDRTRGLDYESMLCGKFQLTNFSQSDSDVLDLLRPQTVG